MAIKLVPVNVDNWFECSQLVVKPEQERFISSNLLCIAEVQFNPNWEAYALYSDNAIVGFAMVEYDDATEEWWLSSLMIAAEHQGNGYGRLALKTVIDGMTAQGCTEINVGYAPDNVAARNLYHRYGFVEVGIDDEGDMVCRLNL